MKEERKDLRRPGGELASRPLHFFWLLTAQDQCLEKRLEH